MPDTHIRTDYRSQFASLPSSQRKEQLRLLRLFVSLLTEERPAKNASMSATLRTGRQQHRPGG